MTSEPNAVQSELKAVSMALQLDSACIQRALLLYADLSRKSPSRASPLLKARIVLYVAANMNETHTIAISRFLNKEITLDIFIQELKEALELLELSQAQREKFTAQTSLFGYMNSIYKKLCSLCKIFAYKESSDKEVWAESLKITAWILFVIAQKQILKTGQIFESLALLGLVFSQAMAELGSKIEDLAVLEALNIRNKEGIAWIEAELQDLLSELRAKEILKNGWKPAQKPESVARKLEQFYQQNLKVEDLDFRFFFSETKRVSPSVFTPFQKQQFGSKFKPIITDKKLNCQRVLTFEPSAKPTLQFHSVPQPQSTIPSGVFSKMHQSPLTKPMCSPLTNAMELHNWLEDRVRATNLWEDNVFLIGKEGSESKVKKFFETLDSGFQCLILKEVLEQSVEKIVELEIGIVNLKNEKKILNLIMNRKSKMFNLYFSMLNSFLNLQFNDFSKPILKDPDFHRTVLFYCLEAVLFILNISKFDIKTILDIVQIRPLKAYQTNLCELNFEQFLPLSLRKHFSNVENLFMSHLVFCDDSSLLSKEPDPRLKKIFDKILMYTGSQLNLLACSIGLSEEVTESIWQLVKVLLTERRECLAERYVDQFLMCAVYSLSKLFKLNVRFQELISKYQKVCSFSKPQFQQMIYSCRIGEGEVDNIIVLYNKFFIPHFSSEILSFKEKLASNPTKFSRTKSNSIIPKPDPKFKETPIDLLKSPLKVLISTPYSAVFKTNFNSNIMGNLKSKRVLDLDEKTNFERKKEGDYTGIGSFQEKVKKFL